MGTIRERAGRFHAAINCRGYRQSATLDTRELAERWIAVSEAAVTLTPRDLVALSKPARVGAVYILLDADGVVLYVGRTGDLHRRLVRHRELGVPFARYYAIELDDHGQRVKRERELVRTLAPPLNRITFKVGAPRPRPSGVRARQRHAHALAVSRETMG